MALQLRLLNNCNSPYEVTEQLQRLPQGLNESYKQIFAKLPFHHHSSVLIIMQWLAFAKEPLSIDKICEVVAIAKVEEDQQPEFQPGKKWNKWSVERVCADLVTITNGRKFLELALKKKELTRIE